VSNSGYKDGVKRIQEKLRNAKSQEEIDYILKNEADFSANFTFKGSQNAGPDTYSALEWDLGTYSTNIHIDSYNQETGEVEVSIQTTNQWHLESLTRFPEGVKNATGIPFVFTDRHKGEYHSFQNVMIFSGAIPILMPFTALAINLEGGTSYDQEFNGTDTFYVD